MLRTPPTLFRVLSVLSFLLLARSATADVLATPFTVTASSELNGNLLVTNLFEATVTDADVGVTEYGNPQWSGSGLGPHNVFMDFGSTLTNVDGLAYSQRLVGNINNAKVGQIDLWFSDTDFGEVLPATPPDASVNIVNRFVDSVLTQYSFGANEFSGQYVAAQFIAASTAGHIGGSEMRLTTNTPDVVFPTLTINRDTGNITLANDTLSPINIVAYQIESPTFGALDASQWTSFTHNYDGGSPGPNQVSTDEWVEFTPSPFQGELSEAELPGGSGATLSTGTSLDLGNAWVRTPTEDITISLFLEDGSTILTEILYTGTPLVLADYSGNGTVGAEDWPLFRAGLGNNGEGLTLAQAYSLGDLDADGDTDVADFREFRTIFDAANGQGALESLIASVPEPSSLLLLACGGFALTFTRNQHRQTARKRTPRNKSMTRHLTLFFAALLLMQGQQASAQLFTVASPATPTSSFASSEFSAGFVIENLFDDTVTDADLGVTSYAPPEYAARGGGPHEMFFDYGSTLSANYLAFNPRPAGGDKIGQFEFWFSDTDFNNTLPNTPPDSVVTIDDFSNKLSLFLIGETFNAQYVASRFVSRFGGGNPGGREMRFVNGPDVVLEVDRSDGSLSILNLGQAIDIDGYDISSPNGSLDNSWTGFEDGSIAGFDAGDGSGNGWEKGDSSNDQLLAEAFLTGSSTLEMGASLDLGTGYVDGLNAQDLSFSFSIAGGGPHLSGAVRYVGGIPGDFNMDGKVDGADFLTWQRGTPGQYDENDLADFEANYGAGIGSPLGASTVPEPTAFALVAFGAMLTGVRRFRGVCRVLCGVLAIGLVAWSSTTPVLAGTADAIYLFGDNSANGDEDGIAGEEVGQTAADVGLHGFTLDSTGVPATGTFRDLAVHPDTDNERPTYVDTAALNYPGSTFDSTTTGIGARFDGVDDRLVGFGFGNPGNGDNEFLGEFESAYQGLFGRSIDGWTRPTNLSSARQEIVRDTRQFGIHITESNTWGFTYGNVDRDSGVDVASTLNGDGWAHVHQLATGGEGRLYVNGEYIARTPPQGYGGTGGEEIVFGSNLAGDGDFYTGDLDNFRLLIYGANNVADYGGFDLFSDNDYIANHVVRGDANGDGVVNGDGTGDESVDDVTFFVNHYLDQQVLTDLGGNEFVAGDITSMTTMADLNGSGTTNILDWFVLREEHVDAAAIANLDIGALLAGSVVPEPSTLVFGLMALAGFAGRRGAMSVDSP